MKHFIFIIITYMFFFCSSPILADELTILTEEWKPISFSDENGKPTGLAVKIVQEILRRQNLSDQIKIIPWARAYRTALEDCNVIIFPMTQTLEREQLFKMIGPITIGKTAFYAKKGSGIIINSLDDAKKLKSIGVYRDSAAEQILTQAGFTNLNIVSSPILNVRKLMGDRIDVIFDVNLTIGELLVEEGFSHDSLENIYNYAENRLYISMSKDTSEEIVQAWKNTLEEMHKDGTFSLIYKKWLPNEEVPNLVERIGFIE